MMMSSYTPQLMPKAVWFWSALFYRATGGAASTVWLYARASSHHAVSAPVAQAVLAQDRGDVGKLWQNRITGAGRWGIDCRGKQARACAKRPGISRSSAQAAGGAGTECRCCARLNWAHGVCDGPRQVAMRSKTQAEMWRTPVVGASVFLASSRIRTGRWPEGQNAVCATKTALICIGNRQKM